MQHKTTTPLIKRCPSPATSPVRCMRAMLPVLALSVLLLGACSSGLTAIGDGNVTSPSEASNVSATASATQTAPAWPVRLTRSEIARRKPHYIPMTDVGGYEKRIIPVALLEAGSTLPEATVSALPYWTGFVMENMGSVNFADPRWNDLTDGSAFFYEENIKAVADAGFNCCRVMYSLSHLTDPTDASRVDASQLQCLDELVSWGMRYNVHIMLSISGLPGKRSMDESARFHWPNEGLAQENVQQNDELFRIPETAALYRNCMEMLVSRYKGIPSRNLSIELLAEPAVPNGDVALYEDVLLPVVDSLHAIDSTRILIANDVAKQIPERLAKAGCALSLHDHVYAVNGYMVQENFGIEYEGKWPIEYLPALFGDSSASPLLLVCEEGFSAGTLELYFGYGDLQIQADGRTLLTTGKHDVWGSGNPDSGWERVQIPAGTREIRVGAAEYADGLKIVRLIQDGREPVTMVSHRLFQGDEKAPSMPRIRIFPNGSTQNIDEPQRKVDAAYIREQCLQPWIDCAKRNGVGFLLTEVGTDTHDLDRAAYEAYEGAWLSTLKQERIPWMYNCLHGVLAPRGSVQTDVAYACGFTQVEQVPGTPFEKVSDLFEWLKTYR